VLIAGEVYKVVRPRVGGGSETPPAPA